MSNIKGIVRKVEDVGRVVLPKELRKSFNINDGTSVDIYPENGRIVLEVVKNSCLICNGADNLRDCKGNYICQNYIAEMSWKI